MPLSNFWGINVDRSVPGQATLALNDFTKTVPWDGHKPTKSDLYVLFQFLNDYVAEKEIPSGDIWDIRTQYARHALGVMDYDEAVNALPPKDRKAMSDKRDAMVAERDRYKLLAGD